MTAIIDSTEKKNLHNDAIVLDDCKKQLDADTKKKKEVVAGEMRFCMNETIFFFFGLLNLFSL